MAAIGSIIDGKYEILAELGRGGMSIVYLAMDRRLNKQWAIKEAKKKPGHESEIFELTPIAEANLLKNLNHDNIVRIVDIIDQGGTIYIVMDYVEGMSLEKEVQKGPSSPEDVVNWGAQLCDVLEYLHTRSPAIIYRDMKPANVQLSPDRQKIKLLDFGIAKTYKAQNTGDTYNLGTRGYAAPEQFDVNRQSDARTDIFSLGVTLRALLMGKTPNQAEFYDDIRKYNPAVSDGMVKVISKATDQNPENRYQTAADFRTALLHYHDKDDAVISFKKKKLRSFRALMVSAISFLLVGAILLPTAFVARGLDYNDYIEKKQYSEAINLLPSRSEAYYGMIKNGKDQKDIVDSFSGKDNIKKVSDDKERNDLCLSVVALSFNRDNQKAVMQKADSNNGVQYFYEILANLDESETITDSTDMADILDKTDNVYEKVGRIGLYYCSLYSTYTGVTGFKNAKKAESVKTQLKAIKKHVEDNRKSFERLEFDSDTMDYKSVKDVGMENAYDLVAALQNICVLDIRNNIIDYTNKYGETASAFMSSPEYTEFCDEILIEDDKGTKNDAEIDLKGRKTQGSSQSKKEGN